MRGKQASVFFVKHGTDPEVRVLKKVSDPALFTQTNILSTFPQYDRAKSATYRMELEVLLELKTQKHDVQHGFPKLLSFQQGENSSEIILEALGPNLKTLMSQCPNKRFSAPTCYKLVS